MNDRLLVLLLVTLYGAGKALDHALRDRSWARVPLISGLPLSDLYHACSGSTWLLALWACDVGWGAPWEAGWRWWLAMLGLQAVIWPASKLLKYDDPTWQDVLAECWWVQIAVTLYRRLT